MAKKYTTLWEYRFAESDDPDDGSSKMIEVLLEKERESLSVRASYTGPSGNFVNNPPTYAIREENEEALLEAIPRAFERARLYEEALEEFLATDGIDRDRAFGLLDLIDDEEDIQKLKQLAEE